MAHEDKTGGGGLCDHSSGPTLLSHCTLSPISTPTIFGIAVSIPSSGGHP